MSLNDYEKRTVVHVIPDVEDREIHVTLIEFPGTKFKPQVEIAHYIPSIKTYGEGFAFPARLLAEVGKGERAVKALLRELEQ